MRKFDAVTVTLNPSIDRMVTIRRFAKGAVNRAESVVDVPGGKGVNVAVALAEHGLRVAATGFRGSENTGPFEKLFARKKIADRFVLLPGSTRVSIKIVDPVEMATTDVNFAGLGPNAREMAALWKKLAAIDASWAIVAGSAPPGVGDGCYGEIIGRLKDRGTLVALDTSGEALAAAIRSRPNLVKPNLHELSALVGRTLRTETEIVAAARGLVERGVELVAVSMGAAGAWFVTAGQAILARPPAIEAAGTVGAGDAMVAGMVVARLRNLSFEDSARLATAFAANAMVRNRKDMKAPAAFIRRLAPAIATTPFREAGAAPPGGTAGSGF